MFKYDYPLLPKADLINLELHHKMDNFFPLYCYYTIWLKFKWKWDSPVITSAWWSTSFQLSEIIEQLDITINNVEIACKYYGMDFTRIRTVKQRNATKCREENDDEDTKHYTMQLSDEVIKFYYNLKWYKKHKYDEFETAKYIVNDHNKYLHNGFLWEIYDTVAGYRCLIKNPLTELEKTTIQECK